MRWSSSIPVTGIHYDNEAIIRSNTYIEDTLHDFSKLLAMCSQFWCDFLGLQTITEAPIFSSMFDFCCNESHSTAMKTALKEIKFISPHAQKNQLINHLFGSVREKCKYNNTVSGHYLAFHIQLMVRNSKNKNKHYMIHGSAQYRNRIFFLHYISRQC